MDFSVHNTVQLLIFWRCGQGHRFWLRTPWFSQLNKCSPTSVRLLTQKNWFQSILASLNDNVTCSRRTLSADKLGANCCKRWINTHYAAHDGHQRSTWKFLFVPFFCRKQGCIFKTPKGEVKDNWPLSQFWLLELPPAWPGSTQIWFPLSFRVKSQLGDGTNYSGSAHYYTLRTPRTLQPENYGFEHLLN